VSDPWKYAVVERERRFLVRAVPDGVVSTREIVDRYVDGTRLRLREVRGDDGSITRKLTQKVRVGDGPAEVACTNLYLDDAEWVALHGLTGAELRKTRHLVQRDGLVVAIDELEDGTLLAEIDDADQPPREPPAWLDVIRDVSGDEQWTGAALARTRSATA
jgi:CYTH domain-containing protein